MHEVTFENDELVVVCSQGEHNLIDVLQVLRSLDIPMGHVSSRAPTLNDVFLALTGMKPARLSVRHIRRRR